MENLRRDARHALRSMRRAPLGYALAALFTAGSINIAGDGEAEA
jgi:hypothetical protein